jgi:hypothetical protein
MPVKTFQFELDALRQEWDSLLEGFMRQTEMDVYVVCTC